VDFYSYAASFFNPFFFVGPLRNRMGCGASALALLTGTAPEVIKLKHKSSHFSDDFMVRFLRRKGFRTLALTQCNLSLAGGQIGAAHVLLIAQLFRRNEGTWSVMFDGNCFHNFDVYQLEHSSFLTKPILSAHLVVHPSWQSNQTTLAPKSLPEIKPPKNGITMAGLHKSGLGWRKGT